MLHPKKLPAKNRVNGFYVRGADSGRRDAKIVAGCDGQVPFRPPTDMR